MEIEVRVIEGCPHVASVLEAVRMIASERDDVVVVTRVILTDEEAASCGFTGSPTVLIDGEDPFPSAGGVTGLSCRRFPLSGGGFGVPDEAMLRRVIHAYGSEEMGRRARGGGPERDEQAVARTHSGLT